MPTPGKEQHEPDSPLSRRTASVAHGRLRRFVGLLVVAIALAAVAIAGHSTLRQAIATLGHIRWQWIPPAVLAEATSMGAFARMQRHLLRVGGVRLRLISTLAVTYAGNAISLSLPVAGAPASIGFAFRQFRRLGADSVAASWALGVSWVISTFTFGLTLAAGALTTGNTTATAVGFLSATMAVVPLVGTLLTLRHGWARNTIGRLASRVWTVVGRISRHPTEEGMATVLVDRFLDGMATIRMSAASYLEVCALSLWNWLGSVLCLVFAILATGGGVPWHGLLLAYGAGAGVALIPLTPGGVGVVEVALSAALVVAGMRGSQAVAAVLVFRLISFWLVVGVGWIVVAVLYRSTRPSPLP
ncbi:MAG: lysylphosphatidylglycerol synthase transmembrane domain-containing protein [Acidimicrobiales bacterium]